MRSCATLFSGGGLADVGLKAAGYTPALAVEYDEAIAEAYAANHGSHIHVSKVEAFNYRPYAGVELLWASPSCVNASVAKTDAGETDGDRAAAAGVCSAIRHIRPRFFCLENVRGYAKFDSFQSIVRTLWELGYGVEWSVVNSADHGVPQTRQRLILRAALGVKALPPLTPTHAEKPDCGGLFGEFSAAETWNGWYGAVEDLLPGLPESKFAPWQLARLEKALRDGGLRDFLVHPTDQRSMPVSWRDEPAFTVTTGGAGCGENGSAGFKPRAFLVDCVHRTDGPLTVREGDEPSYTIVGSTGRREANLPRALLIDGDNAGKNGPCHRGPGRDAPAVTNCSRPLALLVGDQRGPGFGSDRQGVQLAEETRPAPAVRALASGGAPPRAMLVSNAKTEYTDGLKADHEPAFTTTGEQGGRLRALLSHGRVVAMTARALARFQAVPDDFRLPEKNALAYRIVGNGVPCDLARVVAESLEPLR